MQKGERTRDIPFKHIHPASEVFPDVDEVSPYFDLATSALETLKGESVQVICVRKLIQLHAVDTASRLDEEARLKESTSMRSTIEDCRIWMIDHIDCIQDAPLPALTKMGKLFDRLQEGLYNAVILPESKQIKALRTQEKSLKTGKLHVKLCS